MNKMFVIPDRKSFCDKKCSNTKCPREALCVFEATDSGLSVDGKKLYDVKIVTNMGFSIMQYSQRYFQYRFHSCPEINEDLFKW